MQHPHIYLDNHATTKPDPRVVRAMLPFLEEHYGNASSRVHLFGMYAAAAVKRARAQVAALLGALPEEIVFTSGATESINLALRGVLAAAGRGEHHVVTVATEHRAVLDAAAALARTGVRVTVLPVDGEGRVELPFLASALDEGTALVSVMMGNNEIGTVAPIEEIGRLCRSRGILFHCDATQAAGHLPVDVERLSIDLLSISAHKMHGPKGVGALFLRGGPASRRIAPVNFGGGQEGGMRPGTLDVPAIVGFGVAAEIAAEELPASSAHLRALRDRFVARLQAGLGGVRLNGSPVDRLPQNIHLTIDGAPADDVLVAMPEIALSTGSACSTASPGPSHVLLALGLTPEEIRCSLRVGLSKFTTDEELDAVHLRLVDTVRALRARRGTVTKADPGVSVHSLEHA